LHPESLNLHPQPLSRDLDLFQLCAVSWIVPIPEDSHAGKPGNCLLEELQPFST
jgi:hypothetical protein